MVDDTALSQLIIGTFFPWFSQLVGGVIAIVLLLFLIIAFRQFLPDPKGRSK